MKIKIEGDGIKLEGTVDVATAIRIIDALKEPQQGE